MAQSAGATSSPVILLSEVAIVAVPHLGCEKRDLRVYMAVERMGTKSKIGSTVLDLITPRLASGAKEMQETTVKLLELRPSRKIGESVGGLEAVKTSGPTGLNFEIFFSAYAAPFKYIRFSEIVIR